ncbi:MAG: hypothetical protein N2Z72_04205 [Bacteroidales bacterium]|nr:hypothetical protein [Bacteroidales bacterium]
MFIKRCFFLYLILANSLVAQNKKVLLQNANVLEYNKDVNPDVQRLIGNVIFEHDGSLLFCDSAYFYLSSNSVKALGKVHIQINDSVSAYGDELFYDGDKKLVHLRGKEVELRDGSIRLLTKELSYDINQQQAYYLDGGIIQDPRNTLKSKHGYYFTDRKEFFFRFNVQAEGTKYKLTSDSMLYNTDTEILSFFGKTHITYDSTHLWFKMGWFNSIKLTAKAWDSAFLRYRSSILKADTIFYDDKSKIGKGFIRVHFTDTNERTAFTSNFALYRQLDSSILLTDSALFFTWNEENDTLYLHADTLFSYVDSMKQRCVAAFHKVRFYHPQLQGRCDSLFYTTADSILKLYYFPIIWYDQFQAISDTIQSLLGNKSIKEVMLKSNAFIHYPFKKDSYNQVKGKNIQIIFQSGQISKMNVINQSEILYFIDDSVRGVAADYSQAEKMTILFSENEEIEKVFFYQKIKGSIYPYDQIPKEKKILEGFHQHLLLRPQSVGDLFRF